MSENDFRNPRIIFDATVFSLQRRGGISRYSYELLKRMESFFNSNVSIEILVVPGIELSEYYQRLRDLRVLWRKLPSYSLVTVPLIGRAVSEKNRAIYHSPYLMAPRFSENVKRLITVHDIHFNDDPGFRERLRGFIQFRSIHNAEFITTVSNATAVHLKTKFPGLNKPISVIYPGVDEIFLRATPPSSSFDNFFVYVGRRHGYKNFEVLLHVEVIDFMKRSNMRVKCIGGEEVSESELQKIRALKAETCFEFCVSCDDEQLVKELSHCRAVILTSRKEGFGLPVIEALAVGAPVIAAHIEVFREVGRDMVCYYQSGSPHSLVKAMSNILFGDKRYPAHVLKEYAANFCWENTAASTFHIYEQTLFG